MFTLFTLFTTILDSFALSVGDHESNQWIFCCGKSAHQPINTEVMCMIYKPWIVASPTNNYMRWRKTLEGALGEHILSQGTIQCTPNSVPMVFIVFNLGILGDYKTHYIGLT